jgi:XRE family transcriptional regulator, regulator of sulfur utilization
MSISKIVGERIRTIRKGKGVSQDELAHLSSLSVTYIGQIERGEKNITVDSLAKITTALGTPIEELFQSAQILGDKGHQEKLIQIVDKLSNRTATEQQTILELIDIVLGLVDKKNI